jgi:nucleotide-binding universal stress UspA family protein
MFRNLVVPVDGSPLAERSIPWAFAIAAPGAAIELIHVHVAPAPLLVEGVVVADPMLDTTLRAQETEYLNGLMTRATAAAPELQITTVNLDTDQPLADAVAKAATDRGAELVVMTTHGRGPLTRFLIGSVADETIRYSPVPVLVIRVEESESSESPAPDLTVRPILRQVLIPLDGSPLAEKILPAAAKLAKCFSADLGLLAVTDPNAEPAAVFSHDGATATEYLQRIASEVAQRDGVKPIQMVRSGSPVGTIVATSQELGDTAVALATHGRAGLSRLFLGSVADEVIRSASGPVLVFHPHE